MAIPLVLLAIAGSAIFFQPSVGFEWRATSPDDGATVTACIGERVSFAWEYAVGEDEVVLNTEWHRISDEETVLAAHTSGYFFKSLHMKMNVQFLPNAGIQISNYSWADFATYRVTVKYTHNNVLRSASRSVILSLPDVPVIAGDRLLAYMQPEPVIDTDTGDRHVQLTCGQFLSLGSMGPESVVWRIPSGERVPSTSYTHDSYHLTLPNPVVAGPYHCYLKDPSQAERCAKSVKAMLTLKHGAHVQIDEVHARLMLLDGEVRSLQVKDAQKHAELKRQREADSNLMSRLESLASDLDHFQDELSEQNATDNQLMSDVLRLEEKTSLQDNNHTLDIANLKNEMLLQEKRDQSSLSAVSSEVDQLRSELSQQNSVIAELRETEQNLQSTMKEVAANVTLDLKTLLQQAETKWAADIQKLKQKKCPARFRYKHGESCYWVSNETATFSTAVVKCSEMDGKLVEIETSAENNFVKELARMDRTKSYWIAATDVDEENRFIWVSDNRLVQFFNWGGRDPDGKRGQNCVVLLNYSDFDFMWADNSCTSRSVKYICEASLE